MFVQLFLFRSSLARLPGAPPRALSAGGAGLGLASMMRLAPPRSGQAARLRALACSSCARVALPACLAVFPSTSDPICSGPCGRPPTVVRDAWAKKAKGAARAVPRRRPPRRLEFLRGHAAWQATARKKLGPHVEK
ncbi:unnamed protein product [Prorocentrum cordatum]|uniref:Uncharacterized protein n=1 Tax=Prorocentrum cordatum TaxID=2364126 RepID=A0ABN9Q1L8_9DINO|nr:unnamed protein product [Polarella glacialis]